MANELIPFRFMWYVKKKTIFPEIHSIFEETSPAGILTILDCSSLAGDEYTVTSHIVSLLSKIITVLSLSGLTTLPLDGSLQATIKHVKTNKNNNNFFIIRLLYKKRAIKSTTHPAKNKLRYNLHLVFFGSRNIDSFLILRYYLILITRMSY